MDHFWHSFPVKKRIDWKNIAHVAGRSQPVYGQPAINVNAVDAVCPAEYIFTIGLYVLACESTPATKQSLPERPLINYQ
jgi:hypothetical protein